MMFPTIKTFDKNRGPQNLVGGDCLWAVVSKQDAAALTADGTHVALVGCVSYWRTPNGASGSDIGFCIINQAGIAHADTTYRIRFGGGVRTLFGGDAIDSIYYWVADIRDYTAAIAREQAARYMFNARLEAEELAHDAEWADKG